MAKRGRKPMPIDEDQVRTLASQGLNQQQVAAVIGISDTQWYERIKKKPEIGDAYKRGKAKGVLVISNALFDQARNGNITAQIFYLKCMGGWRENTRIEITGADGGPIQNESIDARERVLDKLAILAKRKDET